MKIKLYLLSAFFLVFSAGLFFLPDILASSITAKEQRTVDISSLSSASSPSIETAMSQAQSFSIMEESDQSQLDMVNRLREELNQLFQKLSMPKEPVIVQDYEVLISEDSVFGKWNSSRKQATERQSLMGNEQKSCTVILF